MLSVAHTVFSACLTRFHGRALAVVLRVLTALEHRPVRLATIWLPGLLVVTVLYWHLTTSARNRSQTLGWLSWFVESLIALGRTFDNLFTAFGWHIVVAFIAMAIATAFVMIRGQKRRSLIVAILAAALGLASILCMAERHMGAAVGLALGAAILLLPGRQKREQLRESGRGWPLLIPLAVGGVLRFWSLAEYPRGFAQHAVEHLKGSLIFYEELVQILLSFDLSSVSRLWALLGKQWGPMSMVDGVGFFVFGVGWVQARLTQAVLGCLAICVAYALGTCLDGRRLGFLFSFLLAVSPWHLAFSRYGDAEHVLPTLQALLAILFVLRAARFGRTLDYILAGFTVGMSWYVYATNQIVPIFAAVFLVYKLIASRGFLRRDGVKLVYMAAVFLLTTIPHVSGRNGDGLWLARTPITEFNPYAVTELRTAQDVGQQLFWQVDESWFLREGGGLGPAVQTLFIVGTVLCAAGLFVSRRRDSSVLLLLWLALSFLPAVFSNNVQFRRLLLTLVVALALASVAILRTLRLLEEGGISRITSRVILIALCVLGAATSSFVYFEEVRIGECNLHINHTEMAEYVSKHFGEAYLYVFAPTETDKWTVEDYISLFAYERFRELGLNGIDESDLVAVFERRSLRARLRESRSVDGKMKLIASGDGVGEWDDPASLRTTMASVNLVPRRHGELFIWEWRSNYGSRIGRRVIPGAQRSAISREPEDSRDVRTPAGGD